MNCYTITNVLTAVCCLLKQKCDVVKSLICRSVLTYCIQQIVWQVVRQGAYRVSKKKRAAGGREQRKETWGMAESWLCFSTGNKSGEGNDSKNKSPSVSHFGCRIVLRLLILSTHGSAWFSDLMGQRKRKKSKRCRFCRLCGRVILIFMGPTLHTGWIGAHLVQGKPHCLSKENVPDLTGVVKDICLVGLMH